MPAYGTHPNYPTEITPDEAAAGFEACVLDHIVPMDWGVSDRNLVVCKVLGPSEVIVKMMGEHGPEYNFRRFGSFDRDGSDFQWLPVGHGAYADFRMAIDGAVSGVSEMHDLTVYPQPARIERP